MTISETFLLFKLVLSTGLALWVTLVAANNIIAFSSGVAAVGGMMSMQLFDQEPAVRTALLARRVKASTWHSLIYIFVLMVEGAVGGLLWYAAVAFAGVFVGTVDVSHAIARANLALSAFALMIFILTLGGVWFAYYIRQEGLQITHFVLLMVAIAAAIVMNLSRG